MKHWGAISGEEDQILKDGEKRVGHDFCGDSALLKAESDCSKFVKFDEMTSYYDEKCKGQTSCNIDFSSFMKDKGENDPEYCFSKYTQIYLQTQCSPSDEEVILANQTACMTIFLGMLMALFFGLAVRYLENIQ